MDTTLSASLVLFCFVYSVEKGRSIPTCLSRYIRSSVQCFFFG